MNRRAGSAFQGILESSGLFSEVNVREIVVPISKCDEAQMGELLSTNVLWTGIFMFFWIEIGVRRIAESFRRMLIHF